MAADRIAAPGTPPDAEAGARGRAPMPIALLLSDVDGTLVTTEKVLTPRTRAAVRALGAAGIGFAITSSRPPRGMAMLIEPLGITTPIAGFNGGVITRPDLTPIEQHFVAPEIGRRAVALMQESGLDAWVFAGEDWLITNPAGPHVAHEEHTVQFPPVIAQAFGTALDHPGKIVGVSDDHDRVARCEALVQAAVGAAATVNRSQLYYLDVTHPRANKGRVVGALARRLGIPAAAIATIGDGENDLLMFAASGLSIAMGNAGAAVKAKADFVTAGNDEDGFAAAVEQIILPRARRGGASG